MEDNIINRWLKDNGDPEITKQIEETIGLQVAAANYEEQFEWVEQTDHYSSFIRGALWMKEQIKQQGNESKRIN